MAINASRAVVGLIALVLSGCGSRSATSPSGAPSNAATVSMPAADYLTGLSSFNPGTVTVFAGGTVTWKNDDTVNHTSVSNTSGWDLTVSAGASVTRTFPTKGTFPYHCAVHSNMTGTVVVQ